MSTNMINSGVLLYLLVLLLSPASLTVDAQMTSPPADLNYPSFSPSMAVIIIVLVAALFFMAIFSIYIRRCSNDGSGVRQALSMRRGRGVAAARGLDASVIETFPTFPYATVKGLKIGKGALECAVCLNEFEDDETLRLIPKCDHVFHPECIDAWLENHVTCPVCRADLVPQPGDTIHLPGESELLPENSTAELGSQSNGDVSIQIPDDHEANVNNDLEAEPEMLNRNSSLRHNLPPRSQSVKPKSFLKFRSHSTGHSLVQPGENTDRYTLRLPEEVRKQVMSRALLNRNASSITLPRLGSSRRGYRTGTGEGSNRGRSYRRLESLRIGRSDRWIFARAPSFLTRAFSPRSPRVMAESSDALALPSPTTATTPKGSKMAAKPPLSGSDRKADEITLVTADSAQLPV